MFQRSISCASALSAASAFSSWLMSFMRSSRWVGCVSILRVCVFLGGFGELDQTPFGAFRVEIRDPEAGVTNTWNLIDQRHALGLELGERLVDVLDFEADVVDAGLAVVAHLRELAVRLDAREELDHRFPDGIERELVGAAGRVLGFVELDAENGLPEVAARFEIANDDADVLDALDLHCCPLSSFKTVRCR